MLHEKQSAYYNDIIEDIGRDQTRLFKEVNKIMHRDKCNPMPTDIPLDNQPDAFNEHFASKIEKNSGQIS